jgi:hypothetical protein
VATPVGFVNELVEIAIEGEKIFERDQSGESRDYY